MNTVLAITELLNLLGAATAAADKMSALIRKANSENRDLTDEELASLRSDSQAAVDKFLSR